MPDKTAWEKLREPFPPEQIGTIPKGGVQLSYVGHAAVTDRLLQVDPEWAWEPMGVDDHGRPILAENLGGMQGEPFGLWIKLTVNGVTRPGFGGGKNAKECISDALRNAAMRFGVALDLWAKEDLSPPDSSPLTPKASQFKPPPAKGVTKEQVAADAEASRLTKELVNVLTELGQVEAGMDLVLKNRAASPDLNAHKDFLSRSIATKRKELKKQEKTAA